MGKRITSNQFLGELGETAIKKLVLEMHFIYDTRGRLEAGTDGTIELCVRDTPLGGSPGRDHWVFTFKNGRVWTAAYSYQECEGYSPFNELVKQK
ncbi:MAG: hypothetical protein J2P54_05545 [Bradyrhizobiaceae bacterium]|nr:hypothetical protein [Bradyrhizobiaceae bacterium]